MTHNDTYKSLFGSRRDPDGNLVHENFARWFEGSAVRNDSGPIPLYHAVKRATEFDSLTPFDTGLTFFAENPMFCEFWLSGSEPDSQMVCKVFVNAQYVWDFENPDHVSALLAALEARKGREESESLKKHVSYGHWLYMEFFEIPEILRSMGFEAMWVTEENGAYMNVLERNLAVFDTASVKSAHGNSGRFDRSSKSLLDQ
jgi:hypothetical protein